MTDHLIVPYGLPITCLATYAFTGHCWVYENTQSNLLSILSLVLIILQKHRYRIDLSTNSTFIIPRYCDYSVGVIFLVLTIYGWYPTRISQPPHSQLYSEIFDILYEFINYRFVGQCSPRGQHVVFHCLLCNKYAVHNGFVTRTDVVESRQIGLV